MLKLFSLWLFFGFVIYLSIFIKRLREPNGFSKLKELYKKNGIVPFLYGASAILLGPLILAIPLWLNKK